MYGMMYTPVGLDVKRKYPVVLYVYAGPQAQLATNSYKAVRSDFRGCCCFELYAIFFLHITVNFLHVVCLLPRIPIVGNGVNIQSVKSARCAFTH